MSTPVSKDYLVMNNNANHEIQWLKNKIVQLRGKYIKRPRTIKEIRDLERQIRDRGGEPEKHEWLPNTT